MNLKEAFRYQHFLDVTMRNAANIISSRDNSMEVVRRHNRNAVNPEDEDIIDEQERDTSYFRSDDIILLMEELIEERAELTKAINKAKASIDFDIDAAVESNKFRQLLKSSLKTMLDLRGSHTIQKGTGYKFNADGVQAPYFYDIEVEIKEAFDRERSKQVMRNISRVADETSAEIDAAMVNTIVDYIPIYDVNDAFEDIMTEFTTAT